MTSSNVINKTLKGREYYMGNCIVCEGSFATDEKIIEELGDKYCEVCYDEKDET